MRRISFSLPARWLAAYALLAAAAASADDLRREPAVHALVGARIVQAPGQVLDSGTLIIRDGLIEAVGAEIEPPADARIWQSDDLTLYPGLIESFHLRDWPEKDGAPKAQAGHANGLVRPERDMLLHAYDEAAFKKLREAGFTTAVLVPKAGLFRGASVLMNLGDGPVQGSVLARQVAQNAKLQVFQDFSEGYPASTMGAVALFRQTLLDARWHREAQAVFAKNPRQPRPRFSTALDALEAAVTGGQPMVLESSDLHDTLRLAGLAREFGLNAVLVGTGDEYRRLEEIARAGLPMIVPIDFPKAPKVPEEDDLSVSLEALRRWDRAPDNPRLLAEAGVDFVLSSHDLSDAKKIHAMAAKAVERGYSADEVLAAFTTRPAERLGLSDRAGTLEAGKMANVIVADGDLFRDDTAIRSLFIDGRRFEIREVEAPTIDPIGTWEVVAEAPDGSQTVTLVLTGTVDNLSGSVGTPLGSLPLDEAYVSGNTVEVSFNATVLGLGTVTMSMTVDGESATGSGTTADGPFEVTAERVAQSETPELQNTDSQTRAGESGAEVKR